MELEKTTDKVVSVSQLTASIKGLLEGGIGSVVVRGEISNWKPAFTSLKVLEDFLSGEEYESPFLESGVVGEIHFKKAL